MDHKLKDSEFADRLKNYGSTNLITIYGVMKGISLGAATLVTINLFTNTPDIFPLIIVIIFLIASFLGMIVTFEGSFFGAIFLSHMPSWKDNLFSFLLAAFEFMLFALLILPEDTTGFEELERRYIAWPLVFSLFSLTSFLIMRTVKKEIKGKIHEYYESKNLMNLVDLYITKLEKPINASIWSFCIFLILFLTTLLLSMLHIRNADFYISMLAGLTGIVAIVFMIGGLRDINKSRNKLYNKIKSTFNDNRKAKK